MSCRRGAVREVAKGKIDGGRESQGMREGGRRCLWENRVAGLVMQAMQERWERVEKRRMEKRAGGRAAIDREWKSDSGSGLRSPGEMTRKRVPPRMARAFCLVWADRRQRQRAGGRAPGVGCFLLLDFDTFPMDENRRDARRRNNGAKCCSFADSVFSSLGILVSKRRELWEG
jgi:hypothetical protein